VTQGAISIDFEVKHEKAAGEMKMNGVVSHR